MSKREQVLNALLARLASLQDVTVLRNETLPQKIPREGLVILRDGNVGDPEVLLSPTSFIFHHQAEVEVLMQRTLTADTDAALDTLLEQIGQILTQDPTLSGLVDHMHAEPPEFVEQPIDGGITIKGAVVPITLEYMSNSNLT